MVKSMLSAVSWRIILVTSYLGRELSSNPCFPDVSCLSILSSMWVVVGRMIPWPSHDVSRFVHGIQAVSDRQIHTFIAASPRIVLVGSHLACSWPSHPCFHGWLTIVRWSCILFRKWVIVVFDLPHAWHFLLRRRVIFDLVFSQSWSSYTASS